MIEKKKENPIINRLQTIDKFEADYNLLLKLYWPKIMNNIAKKKQHPRKKTTRYSEK